jgi:putative Mn2+ efflux pump MntP
MASEQRESPSPLGAIVGLVVVLVGLSNPFDQFFCSSGCGVVDASFASWLSAHIGHWATRALIVFVGVLAIVRWVKAVADAEPEAKEKEKDAI